MIKLYLEKSPNRKTLERYLLILQLSYIGKTIEDTLDVEMFQDEWVFSYSQYIEFREEAIPVIKKALRCNRSKAEKAFNDFYEQLGLRINRYAK